MPEGQDREEGIEDGFQDTHYRNAGDRTSDRSGRDAERRLCRTGERGVERRRPWHIDGVDAADAGGTQRRNRALPRDDRQAVRRAPDRRSEERRAGKELVSAGRSRWSPYQ